MSERNQTPEWMRRAGVCLTGMVMDKFAPNTEWMIHLDFEADLAAAIAAYAPQANQSEEAAKKIVSDCVYMKDGSLFFDAKSAEAIIAFFWAAHAPQASRSAEEAARAVILLGLKAIYPEKGQWTIGPTLIQEATAIIQPTSQAVAGPLREERDLLLGKARRCGASRDKAHAEVARLTEEVEQLREVHLGPDCPVKAYENGKLDDGRTRYIVVYGKPRIAFVDGLLAERTKRWEAIHGPWEKEESDGS